MCSDCSMDVGCCTFVCADHHCIQCRLPKLRILLSHTKIPRSTKTMVSEVRRRWDAHPQVVNPILQSIHAISEGCEKILGEFSGSELDAEMAKYLCVRTQINVGFILCTHANIHTSTRTHACTHARTHTHTYLSLLPTY